MTLKPIHFLGSLLLAGSFSFAAAQTPDKPADAAAQDRNDRMAARAHGDFHQWEEQLHTTDCAKMPTRTLMADCEQAHAQRYVVMLQNAASQNDANEILVAVRNLFDPSIKIFLSSSQNAVAITTYPEEFARIQAFIKSIDLPRPTYRITLTLTESDAGKRLGVQHTTLIAAAGQRTSIKQGSKVPVVTGSYKEGGSGSQDQFTYLDIGLNISVEVDPMGNRAQMKVKVEQSSVANETDIGGVHEPVVRQSVFDGVPNVTIGKAQAIGQIDIPGSTRHIDIDALVETM